MSSAVDEFKYSEHRLAEALGVSRADLKFIRDRQLELDRDWKKNGGGFVALAESGVSKILSALGGNIDVDLGRCLITSDDPHPQTATLGLSPLPEKNGAVSMTVAKIPLNPRVVLATNDARELCTVDVGNSLNFVVGDAISAVPHSAQPGFWRFVGQMPHSRRRINGQPV